MELSTLAVKGVLACQIGLSLNEKARLSNNLCKLTLSNIFFLEKRTCLERFLVILFTKKLHDSTNCNTKNAKMEQYLLL